MFILKIIRSTWVHFVDKLRRWWISNSVGCIWQPLLFRGNFPTFKWRYVRCYGVRSCSFLNPHTWSGRLFLAECNFGHLECRVVGSKTFPGCGVIKTEILDSCVGSELRSFSLQPVNLLMIYQGLFHHTVSHTCCILTLDMDWKCLSTGRCGYYLEVI